MTGYDQLANKKQLMSHFTSWSEPVQHLLEMAPDDGVMLWDLLDMELLPDLIKGKALLIGDAAHPFLPRELAPCPQKSCSRPRLGTEVSSLNRHGPRRSAGHRGRLCPRRDTASRHCAREDPVEVGDLAAVQEGQGRQDHTADEAPVTKCGWERWPATDS